MPPLTTTFHAHLSCRARNIPSNWIRLLKMVMVAASLYLVYKSFFHVSDFMMNITPIDESMELLENIVLDCDGLFEGDPSAVSKYKNWQYSLISRIEATIQYSSSRCKAIKRMFQFTEQPLSQEEKDYPLAYGMVVYMNAVQVLFQLSAFYHPQNEYCIAVSGSAEVYVLEFMQYAADCFPNVHLLKRPPLTWGEFEIINTTFACLEYLQRSKKRWKYFQYLSGVDVPLRTNLEMVQILKRLNNTVNTLVEPYPHDRLRTRRLVYFWASDSPLPLVKSSLSILLPRETAEELVNAPLSRKLLEFLAPTHIADESFWATMLGNPEEFNITGGFDAKRILAFNEQFAQEQPRAHENYIYSVVAMNGYISRYQVWTKRQCRGKIVRYSCVYGVEDLPIIAKQHHFVAHKLYIDFEPAAYFCLLKRTRKRALSPTPFNSSIYAEIPMVEFSRGISFRNLTHPEWLLRLHEVLPPETMP